MNSEEFREFGKAAVDYIAEYTDSLRDRKVLPEVQPGYLASLVPEEAPKTPESWQAVMQDVDRIIMPGITHWTSPQFHAYCPATSSYPSIVGELMIAGMGCVGFSWMSSPACTELEIIMMNWLGKMLGLPKEFLNSSEGPGGGVIQTTASETTLFLLLTAKERTTRRIKETHPDWDEGIIKSKLVAYASDQSNSSVERAGLLGSVKMRLLPADENCSLRGSTLAEAIRKDEEAGLIPCYMVATLGTTGTCAFDNLEELGPICNERNIWLHIDAAYAGAAFVCPEYRYLLAGIEHADSFNFNPHKWLLLTFDCSAMWVKDSTHLTNAFHVDRIYLAHGKQEEALDLRHWQISLGRRFRALKLWFVLRMYGIDGLQNHIRKNVHLAKYFEDLVQADRRFEVVTKLSIGLVCFRMKGDDKLTMDLLDRLTKRRNIYVIPATFRGKFIIRFVVCSPRCEESDIEFAWKEITGEAREVLQDVPIHNRRETERKQNLQEISEGNYPNSGVNE